MKKAPDDLPLFARQAPRFFTISELNQIIKGTLEQELGGLWVVGQISAVMFRRQGVGFSFTPENGMEVLCFGKVSLYPVRGDLQLYVERLEPRGQGALYLAFEQLKKKLFAEGLFAEDRKRALPFLPVSIGI